MGVSFYFFSIIFAFVAYVAFDIYQLHTMGSIFNENKQSDLSSCKRVPEIKGCEDLFIHHASGYAFAGCPEDYTLHKNYLGFDYKPRDKLVLSTHSYFVSYNIKDQKANKLTTKGFPEGIEFGIHGVDFIQDPKDKNTLHFFAVNHRKYIDTVEHFKHVIGTKEIEYVKSFQSKCLTLINSVSAVTLETFYYTQSHSHESGPLNYLQNLGLIPGGKVMFYGGKEDCRELVNGFKYANGISMSLDRKILYVAESHRGKLHMFERDEESSEVELKEIVPLKFIPDNIRVEPTSGHIYIAGFSTDFKEGVKLINYDGEIYKETFKSVAARVVNETGEGRFFGQNYRVEPILVDHGDTMFSTTTAAADEKQMALLLTGLFTGRGMLDCRFDKIKQEV